MSRTGGRAASRTGGRPARRAEESPTRQVRARWLVLPAKVLGVAVFFVVVLGGLFYVRLLQGPIPLKFLVGPIERAIAAEAGSLRVDIEDVAVRLGDSGQLEFALSNIRVSDADDVPLVVAPSASLSLSRKALLAARIAPESVDLISPRLLVFYGDDGSLSLKFSHPGDAAPADQRKAAQRPAAAATPGEVEGAIGRLDLVKMLSEASGRARRGEHAGAYLREIGLRAATVIVDNGTRRSVWRVPELDIDLDHRRSRSSIAGRIKVDSLAGPWTLNFRTREREQEKSVQLDVSIQGLVPRGLARTLPQLAGLEGIDVPIWADAKLDLSNTGEILGGTIAIDAAPGRVLLPWLAATPLSIDGGHLALSYSREARRFEVAPSVLVWGDSRVQFTGSITHTPQAPDVPGWAFDFKSAGGWLGAEPPDLPRLTIDDWSARGFLAPEHGRVVLTQVMLRAGGAVVTAEGDVADMAGAMRARLDGKIGPMPASVFKALWPRAIAPQSRAWVVAHLQRGWLQGASFRVSSGADSREGGGWTAGAQRGSLTLEASNVAFSIVEGWPAVEAPRGLVRLDEQALEVNLPDAGMTLSDGRRLALKGTFSVDMKEPMPRTGNIGLRVQGPLAAALELLEGKPFHALEGTGVTAAGTEGKVDGQMTVSLPLGRDLAAGDVKVEGKVRITEGRLAKVLGPYDVTGASVTIDLAGSAVEARGEMLVAGVLAKARWQHVFGVSADKQPPARITASLDDADRTQLGLDINDLVQGEIGMEVTLTRAAQGTRQVHVRADLANAEVMLDSVAWRKPKGRPSVFEFDVAKGAGTYPLELHNVKMVGDNVAIEGWMGVAADHKVREFRFPQFSLNVVTSLAAHGRMRGDGIWDVTAKGTTYDGRDLFRSFFDLAHLSDGGKIRPGLDLKSEIDTVVGFSDTTLRNVRMTLNKRANKITGLDVRGVLEGGKPFAAVVRPEPGKARRLLAESQDAGQTFKLVGFYPNAVGGQMSLEVYLDGQGAAERTGTLWVRDFVVLGDPIVSEVLQSADGTPQASARRTVLREQFEFESLRVPFSVGHGQFVMHNSAINGPIVSASMRGKVDFRAQSLNVGGTYVPMAGLMRVPAPIPLLGPLLTGPRGEGMFGITFAIQGSMAKPQVIVNPLSIITPGIFREIFQMTPEDPRVLPREKPASRSDAARSSSAPASSAPPSSAPSKGPKPEVGGSWSAETSPPSAR